MGRPVAGPRRGLGHRARERGRARDHRGRPREPRVHRPRHERLRGLPGRGRALHARMGRARDRACPRARSASSPTRTPRPNRAMICWTLGITEHHNAVDNVLALIMLALLTGHVGRYGSGLNPLRGQNNVQGGGDMGAIPDRLPGFQHVENDAAPSEVRRRLGRDRSRRSVAGTSRRCSTPWSAASCGALYVIGENPVQSEADQTRAQHLLETRDFLVVQDLYLTKTAEIGRRRPPGRGGLGRERGHGHELRATGPAGAQGGRAARRGARRPRDHLRARPADGPRLGRTRRRAGLGRGPLALARPRRHELSRGSTSSVASSGRAGTRPTPASCSSIRACGRTRCRAAARRSCRSSTIRRWTGSMTTSRSG